MVAMAPEDGKVKPASNHAAKTAEIFPTVSKCGHVARQPVRKCRPMSVLEKLVSADRGPDFHFGPRRRKTRGGVLLSLLKNTISGDRQGSDSRRISPPLVTPNPAQTSTNVKKVVPVRKFSGETDTINRYGIPRSVLVNIPNTISQEGFLHMHVSKQNHNFGRSRSLGNSWIRVWCAVSEGKLHIVKNMPSQHSELCLEDYVVTMGASHGKLANTFSLGPMSENTAGASKERYTFRTEETETNLSWAMAIREAKLNYPQNSLQRSLRTRSQSVQE
eukprot:CAMPEP_0181312710 /NCGR_PEP_ID=MMETSP1101-20121128/13845_1 /TAXON_ID=46948 /ORGANISM="Rhodomonas abbreviata, Strain Caron Lab Isolate" /LENGTH=274 /DNA_ID=CAMNT_0023419585 /DNA_START=58 /DNA_END=882 /DNA_ORIENTATION=-